MLIDVLFASTLKAEGVGVSSPIAYSVRVAGAGVLWKSSFGSKNQATTMDNPAFFIFSAPRFMCGKKKKIAQ